MMPHERVMPIREPDSFIKSGERVVMRREDGGNNCTVLQSRNDTIAHASDIEEFHSTLILSPW